MLKARAKAGLASIAPTQNSTTGLVRHRPSLRCRRPECGLFPGPRFWQNRSENWLPSPIV